MEQNAELIMFDDELISHNKITMGSVINLIVLNHSLISTISLRI